MNLTLTATLRNETNRVIERINQFLWLPGCRDFPVFQLALRVMDIEDDVAVLVVDEHATLAAKDSIDIRALWDGPMAVTVMAFLATFPATSPPSSEGTSHTTVSVDHYVI